MPAEYEPELRVYLLPGFYLNPPDPSLLLSKKPEGGKKLDLEAAGAAAELFAIFVPQLIEIGLSGVAKLLRDAAEGEEQVSGSEIYSLYYKQAMSKELLIDSRPKCLLGVWGVFCPKEPHKHLAGSHAIAENKLKAASPEDFPPRADIGIIFEAEIVHSSDGSAFYLNPRHFSVGDFLGEIGGKTDEKKEREFVVSLTVATPNETTNGVCVGLGSTSFGSVKEGDSVPLNARERDGFPRFRSNLMPWPTVSEVSRKAFEADLPTKVAEERTYMPVTWTLTFTQSKKANKFLLALADVLDDTKKETAASLSKAILPAERALAAAEREDTIAQLYEDELNAEVAYLESKLAHDNETDPPKKDILKRKMDAAKREWERRKALRKASGLLDP